MLIASKRIWSLGCSPILIRAPSRRNWRPLLHDIQYLEINSTSINIRAFSTKKIPVPSTIARKVSPRAFPQNVSPTTTEPFRPYVARLASRPSPTLLYQAPSASGFIAGCYILAGLCFSYVAFNAWNTFVNPLIEHDFFIRGAVASMCFAVSCFGAWVVFRVSSTLLPFAALAYFQTAFKDRQNNLCYSYFKRPRYHVSN